MLFGANVIILLYCHYMISGSEGRRGGGGLGAHTAGGAKTNDPIGNVCKLRSLKTVGTM